MPNSHYSRSVKIRFALTSLIMLGLLAACGDNTTATNRAAIGGKVSANTTAPQPTDSAPTPRPITSTASRPTAVPAHTAASKPIDTSPAQNVIFDTRSAMATWSPNVPYPTSTPFPTGQPVAGEIPNFGTTVDTHGQVNNPGARQKFLQAYQQGNPGQWEYVLYTDEGDPISHRFVYQGRGPQVTLLVDTTRDKFAGQDNRKIEEYNCAGLAISAKALDIQGCLDSKGQQNYYLSQPLS